MASQLHRYKSLTLRLHNLEIAGSGESDEAEAIRTEADPLWHAMTNAEQLEARTYSKWLHVEVIRLTAAIDKAQRFRAHQTIERMTDDERRDLLWRLIEDGCAEFRVSPDAIDPIRIDANNDSEGRRKVNE